MKQLSSNLEPDSRSVNSINLKPISRLHKLNFIEQLIFGYDFFISYSRRDGGFDYASRLAIELGEQGLETFFDGYDSPPSPGLTPEIRRGLRRAKILLVLATPAACSSPAVEQEVLHFKKTGRPILLIDFADSVRMASWYSLVEGLPFIKMPLHPTEQELFSTCLDYIKTGVHLTRQKIKRERSVKAFIIVLICLGIFSAWETTQATKAQQKLTKVLKKIEDANKRIEDANRRFKIEVKQKIIAELAKKAALHDVALANHEKLKAKAQETIAKGKAQKAIFLAKQAETFKERALQQKKLAEAQAIETKAQNYYDIAIQLWNTPKAPESLLYLAKALELTPENPNYALAFHQTHHNTILKHDAPISNALVDQNKILTLSYDGTAQLWDSHTGQPLFEKPLRHNGPILNALKHALNGAIFSQDGNKILTWSTDGTAQLWNSHTGQPLFKKPLSSKKLFYGATFNHNESKILIWGDNEAQLWDSSSGNPLLKKPLLHNGAIKQAKFNQDESKILTWSWDDHTAQLWDSHTGQPLFKIPIHHKNSIEGVMFNSDESKILTWSYDGTAQFWDSNSGQPLLEKPFTHKGAIQGVLFSQDESKILTWSADGTAQLWDANSGEPLFKTPLTHNGPIRDERWKHAVNGAQFNWDESKILTWSEDGTVQLWDTHSGEPFFKTPLTHNDNITGARFNQNESKILTWSADGTAQLWDANSGEPLFKTPLTHNGPVRDEIEKQSHVIYGAQFNQDESKILTWSEDGTVQLWDVNSGQPLLNTPLIHDDAITGAMFINDEAQILTTSNDGTVQLWDIYPSQRLFKTSPAHSRGINKALFNQDESKILTRSYDNTVQLWDGYTGQPFFKKPLTHISNITLSPTQSNFLLWGQDDSIKFLNANSNAPIVKVPLKQKSCWDALFTHDETKVLIWENDTAQLWDVVSGQPLLNVPIKHQGSIRHAIFNRNESKILTWSGGGTAQLWDSHTGQPLFKTPLTHEKFIDGAIFNRNESKILTWSGGGTAQLWDSHTGQPLFKTPLTHEEYILGAQFNSNENRILTWSFDKTAQLWDARTGQLLLRLPHSGDLTAPPVSSQDGNKILTWSGTEAELWDIHSGEQLLKTPLTHKKRIVGAFLTRDESKILTWSFDNTAQLWDARTGQPLLETPLKHEDIIEGAQFNHDESKILTWSADGTAQLWDIGLPKFWKSTPWRLLSEVLTGETMNEHGFITPLSAEEHNLRKRQYAQYLRDLAN